MQLSPTEYVIYRFGGVRATARALEMGPSSVSKWKKKKHIPASKIPRILEKAKELQLDIRANDLIYGRDIPMSEF